MYVPFFSKVPLSLRWRAELHPAGHAAMLPLVLKRKVAVVVVRKGSLMAGQGVEAAAGRVGRLRIG